MGQASTKTRHFIAPTQSRIIGNSFPALLNREYKVRLHDILADTIAGIKPYHLAFFLGVRVQLSFNLVMNKPEPKFRGKHKKRSHLCYLMSEKVYIYQLDDLDNILNNLFQDLLNDYHEHVLLYPQYRQHNNRGLSLHLF